MEDKLLQSLIPDRPKGMILREEEIELIVEAIWDTYDNCKLLIFGTGNDSSFWAEVNRYGRNIFLENQQKWIDKTLADNPELEIHKVDYHTKLSDWKKYSKMDKIDSLTITIPEEVMDIKWDVIIVDGPTGRDTRSYRKEYGEEPHGRMSSIYMAHKLIADNGTVFIHDITRKPEQYFGELLFGKPKQIMSYLGMYKKECK